MVRFSPWIARVGIAFLTNLTFVAVGTPKEISSLDAVKQSRIDTCAAERSKTFSDSYAEILWGNACILAFGSHYEEFTGDPGRAYILALAAKADASHLCKECDELSENASALKDRLQRELPPKRIIELTKESKRLICDVFPDECIVEALTFMLGFLFWLGIGTLMVLIMPRVIRLRKSRRS
ncbi:MAG: hypothetical protein AB7F41_06955 [Methylocystis sp.]|uniref:hypothetical protein n=1 Tax=Methylocystis sp. TaxID=1911079 RepID=UPI003D10DCDF